MYVDLLIGGSFPWTSHISKYFKVPNFLASQSRDQIARVVETEKHHFLGKRIITLSSAMHIKVDATMHAKSHRFSLLSSIFLLFIYCSLHYTTSHTTMTSETGQISIVVGNAAASCSKSAAGMESKVASVSSSSNMSIQSMTKEKVPKLYEYWKASTITDKDLSAFHVAG
jgi:hypothetical protein